jgi:protein-S-isoprenylcysteine O-methyltransferase Ste14
MAQLLLGAVALALALAFDWVSLLRIAHVKPILGLASAATFTAALAWTLATPGRFDWPAWTAPAGWVLLAAGSLLLVYSFFIEIPCAATYARQGTSGKLVTTGTYALVRHPGVLWLGLTFAGLTLISRGHLMAVASVVWLALDAIYVWLQETLLFHKMFPGYAAYQRTTPMLVPTPTSVSRCLRTLAHSNRRTAQPRRPM